MAEAATAVDSNANVRKQAAYERVCQSYHAVDDFRMKLLGLLPVATGTGVFLLLSGKAELIGTDTSKLRLPLGAIGAFGFLFTLGLLAYELFGIKKCHYLIVAGKRLEKQLEVEGQFLSRPRSVANLINEPFASALIYSACMAAWVFVALVFTSQRRATVLALIVLGAGFAATLFGGWRIAANQHCEDRVIGLVREKRLIALDDLIEALLEEDAQSSRRVRTPRWMRRRAVRRTTGRLKRRSDLIDCGDGLALPPSDRDYAAV